MKFFIYVITCLLIIAFLGLFIVKKPNGETWLTINDLLPDKIIIADKIEPISEQLSAVYQRITASTNHQSDDVKIYRWQDKNGHWGYSDQPNSSTENEEVRFYPDDVIVLPALSSSENNLSGSKKTEHTIQETSLTPSTNKVLELYKDANNVQNLINERQQNLSEAIKNNTN